MRHLRSTCGVNERDELAVLAFLRIVVPRSQPPTLLRLAFDTVDVTAGIARDSKEANTGESWVVTVYRHGVIWT